MLHRHALPAGPARPTVRKEFANTSHRDGSKPTSDQLFGRARHITDVILANLDAAGYRETCSIAGLCRQLETSPAGLRLLIRGLLDARLIEVSDEVVLPTPKLLQLKSPTLSLNEAKAIIRGLQ